MGLKNTSKPIGVVGAGSFGTAVANLLAENSDDIILYVRDKQRTEEITKTRVSAHQQLSDKITVTNDIQLVGQECHIIFPVVPSANFRGMMYTLAPYLRPYHILIHGTKGFDLKSDHQHSDEDTMTREHVRTMSEVIKEESSVVRVGCMAGPNLASEIAEHKPAATMIASPFNEVVEAGRLLLKNDRFLVYGGNDIIGAELCGILKNIIAVGAGLLSGLNMGENARALLISRGLVEMIQLGKVLGGSAHAFLGLAGVGDLIATCGSTNSRNFTVGARLATGMTITEVLDSMEEVAEGVKTIDIIHQLAKHYRIRCVINEMLHKIIHQEISVTEAHALLMKLPFRHEVDYLS